MIFQNQTQDQEPTQLNHNIKMRAIPSLLDLKMLCLPPSIKIKTLALAPIAWRHSTIESRVFTRLWALVSHLVHCLITVCLDLELMRSISHPRSTLLKCSKQHSSTRNKSYFSDKRATLSDLTIIILLSLKKAWMEQWSAVQRDRKKLVSLSLLLHPIGTTSRETSTSVTLTIWMISQESYPNSHSVLNQSSNRPLRTFLDLEHTKLTSTRWTKRTLAI